MKAKKWRELSHEHALDHSFALGSRTAVKVYTNAQKRATRVSQAKTEGKAEPEEHHDDDDGLQSNAAAITNLLNNALGSGIVCMPHMVKMLGIPVGIGVMLVSAVLNRYMLLLVLRCCEIAGVEVSYNTCAKVAFGNAGRLAVVFVFTGMGFGCLVSYVDAVSDSLGGLLRAAGFDPSQKAVLFFGMILLYPPTYIRSLSSVAMLSMVAFIGAIVVCICVLVKCGSKLAVTGLPSAEEIRWTPDSFATVLAFAPTGVCVLAIQAGGSIICSALRNNTPENRSKVTGIAFSICVVIFVSVALPSYLVFLDKTGGDVLEAFDPKDPMVVAAKVAILDLVVLSYMFMMIPCRVALIQLLFKKNEAQMEATYTEFLGVTTGANIAAVFVASLVSDLALVIGLLGSVAANCVAFIIPSMIYIKVRSAPKLEGLKPVPVFSPRNLPFFLLAGFATFSMVSGVYLLLSR